MLKELYLTSLFNYIVFYYSKGFEK